MTRARLLLPALLVLALGVRLFGIDWDAGHHFHPDERRIAEAVSHISFHPLQLDPDFFAYGSFPFYLTRAVLAVAGLVRPELVSYDGAILIGRALSALWGMAAVWLAVLLGRRLWNERAALLGGSLLALAVLHIQTSHFATNDVALSTLATAVLLLLVRAVQDGRRRDLLAAAALAGLAVATKVSALPLLLPVALVVLWRARDERRFATFLGLGTASAATAALAFLAGEPYALLSAKRFLADVAEQSRMVRNAGLLPYTNQYLGTPKLLYELQEHGVWGLGPALGLAALAGVVAACSRALRGRRREEWLLLAFFLPFSAITVSFDVKFLRYLLPVYPLLALWAGVWLDGLGERRAARAARATVVAGTALWALAFLAIYTRPHPVVAASEWFYRNVPPGARVLSQDWDEGFPMPRPGFSADAYRVVNLSYYEPDSPEKIARIAHELARGDLLVFQTKRLYGAITQAKSKFPLTDRYFRELFAGDLGYTLEREFASRPSLLGIEFPSELADESFSVYDHPKVLIFRNTGRLAADQIQRLVLSGAPSRPVSRTAILLAGPGAGGEELAPWRIRASLPALVLVAVLVEILGLATFAVLRWAGWPGDGLYAVSKVLGVLLFAWPVWLAASVGLAPFSGGVLLAWAAALAVLGWLAWRHGPAEPLSGEEIRLTEAVVWGAFAFFLLVRALNPEVFWGEKPMDFAFLNTLYRSTTLPPPEPWFAGTPLSYTYFGHFVAAALGKAVAVHPAVQFNIAVAVFAALTAAALVAAGTLLTGARRGGAIAVAVTLVLGNLACLRELPSRWALTFDYFWATSRVIKDTINEYPFWSFLFADLHAHVMALPFALAFVALLLAWRRQRWDPGTLRPALATASLATALALALGAVATTSAWSAPTYGVLLVGMLALDWLISTRGGVGAALRSLATRVVVPAAAVGLGAWLLFRPFWANFAGPDRSWGAERGPWARSTDVLLVFGFFLVVLLPYLLRAWRAGQGADPRPRSGAGLIFGLLALSLVDLRSLVHLSLRPAPTVFPFAAGCALLALAVALRRSAPARTRTAAALAALAFAAVAGCELVFVWDRMNTIFKFYLDAWLLLGVASALAIHQELWPGDGSAAGSRWWRSAAAAAAAVALVTSFTGLVGVLRGRHVQGPRGTLDGMAYLRTFNPDELAAYEWFAAVPGTPTIVEAYGPPYQLYGRVSMNTGLPTVLGWDYHVYQRGKSWPAINWRKLDVQVIYTATDRESVEAALGRYAVRYVVVGGEERRAYGARAGRSFAAWGDLLRPVFQAPTVTVYAVGAVRALPTPLTRVEPAPVTPAVEPQDPAGRFRQPRGVAVAATGAVYVADFGNNRIQELDAALHPVAVWGSRGEGPGEFRDPCGVAVGPDGRVYVADTWNGRVQVFTADGAFVAEWRGDFYGPRGIAVAADGTVFVADSGNGRVVRFSPAGVIEKSWSGDGTAGGRLRGPVGIAVGRDGVVWVCDVDAGRLRGFDREGAQRADIAIAGWRREVFSEPYVAPGADGMLWVTVPLAGEVRALRSDGSVVRTVSESRGGPPLRRPSGVALDARGDLLVTDIEGQVVRVALPSRAPTR